MKSNNNKKMPKAGQAGNGTKPHVASSSLNTYHVETLDGSGSFNFFTQAENHKKALRNLERSSWDYKKLVKADRDLTIKVKLIN